MLNNKNPNRGGVGARRPGAALVSLLGLALATLAIANPVSLDVIKHSPLGVLVESASSLPAEVRALEQQTAAHVFDRDTTTEHTVYDASQITAQLEAATEVRDIKIFGAAPYTISVEAEVSGGWQAIGGLQNLNLANRADAWSTFSATTPVTASKLRFQLTPVAGSRASGLKAIEIWGKGSRVNVNGGLTLLTALRGTTPPSQGRLIAALPEQGVIGGTTDDLGDNTFTFTLDHDPAQFKRAYLAYEVLGLSHWVGAVRSLNGQAALGGFTLQPGSDWATQVEPVDPAAFRRGENRVAFSMPAGAAGSYTVRKVYLVAELENGANFVVSSAANQPEDGNPTRHLFDGSLTTGWTPYPAANVRADAPALTLGFDKPTQVDGVSVYLVNTLKGSVAVEVLRDKVWSAPVATVANTRTLAAGWNSIALPAGAPADGLRLVFTGGAGSSAELKELQVIGSGVGPASAAHFTVAYPDAGQYYGRTAYIRGFLEPAANASGAAQIFAGAATVPASNGAFELAIGKNDVGLESQGDAEPWSVDLRAVYPDGTTVVSTVTLNNPQPAVESADGKLLPTYKFAVAPGQAKKLAYDAASLELPADAVGSETNIGITPLRAEDLPTLDAGMTNVTKGPRHGYRFTPSPMKFKNKIKVTLPYSKASIPPGHTEADVRTYFFDTQAGSWKVLERVAVDAQKETVTSYTDHFTDMINATVTVPDHPQGVSFNPTLIKDIKAADPGAQINLIAPPEANNLGDARLAYPLEVPPGRQGMQPQLAVQYNSSGGNGWMGMGWDLPTQAITIDTRWGVPRYQADKETETYLLNGEQLTPVAHRGELQNRSGEKVFHTRVEGQFRKIVRHGDHPNNYWWEVTDKNGTRFIYGADPVTRQKNAESTLADGARNGFLWTLREMRDTNGNFVRYHYARVSDTGVAGGSVAGSNLYLKKITYTGHGMEEGAYAVTFLRDRELGEPLRVDKQIDARGGFKRVTGDLLRKVVVSFNGQPVRAYEFQYAEGAFHKTLLQRVVQSDEDGREFNRHAFGYYDEARDDQGYRGFAATASWRVGEKEVSDGPFGKAGASALGGSRGQSRGGHVYVGIGTGTNVTSKTSSAGIKLGYTRGITDTLLAMADMNGDGLPDKVFQAADNRFYYRPNLAKPGAGGVPGFGDAAWLKSLTAIGREKVTSTTLGIESYFVVTAQRDYSVSETETSAYFSDVNGDGLTDLVSGGQVLFGYLNAERKPVFSVDSQDTPVPIGKGAILTANLLEDAAATEAKRAQDFPLLDSLRRWVAPYDGVVAIDAPVHLIKDSSPAREDYSGADGVRVAIQLESTELWSERIASTDYGPHAPAGVGSVAVRKGDRLYFRVQSVFDGAYDQIAWDPEITYRNVDASRTDVNDLTEYRYKASSDFTLAGRRGTVTVPLTGTLHLGGTLGKTGATTDDAILLITKNGSEVYREKLGFAETKTVEISKDIPVAQLDELAWRILVDSPIDASRIRLEPTAYYTAAEGVDGVTDDTGKPAIHVRPPFDMDLYPLSSLSAPQAHYDVKKTGSLPVTAKLGFDELKEGEIAEAVLTVKRRGGLLAKQVIRVTGTGAPVETEVTLSVAVTAGDQLFFDLTSRQASFLAHLSQLSVTTGIAPLATALPVAVHVPAPEELFPQPYRGWGAAGYNGNGDRAARPIDQTLLVLDKAIDRSRLDKAVKDEAYDSESAMAFAFIPQPGGQPVVGVGEETDDKTVPLWGGIDELAWVKAGEISASRLGLDDIRAPNGEDFAGASAVSRISRSVNDASSVGGSLPVGTGGGSFDGSVNISIGNSRSLLDFQDLNGDRFPDIVGRAGTQFSSMSGGLEDIRRGSSVGNARKNNNVSFGGSAGGNVPVAIGNGLGRVTPAGGANAQNGSQGNEMPSLGLGGNLGGGFSDTEYDLIDINGDGLPDRVHQNGTAALNLGYSFAAAEPWNAGIINDGETVNGGVNLGFNVDYYSIGGGLNLGTGTARTDETYADLNGDGLPDKVRVDDRGILRVRLNTGAGFAGEIEWRGGHGRVAADKHITLGGGAYFTFGFTLVKVKIVINPGVSVSTTVGRPELAFRDVDGDGYADHLYSEKDSELKVAANPIGRTNLLKSVARPLGAKIDIEYERDGNTYEQPQSRWVMKKVAVFDGHPGDGVDTLVNTYKYEKGSYDRLERDFYGYGAVIQEQRDAADAVYRSVTQDFHTDSYYTKGLVKRELTSDGAGRPYLETENRYELKAVDAGEAADAKSTSATLFPALVRTERRFFEGQASAALATHTTHDYDALGNVVHFTDTGNAGADDDVEAYIRYSGAEPGCSDRHIVGVPLGIDVVGDGRLMRSRSSRIDCASGDIVQVSRSLENGQASVTDLAYDAYGNLSRVTGPANHAGQRYALDYAYDPFVATHVTRIADSFGYSSTASHHYKYGKVETTTDLNGQQTTYVYDKVGRPVTLTGPYEQHGSQATIRFDYHPEAAVPYALTQHVDRDASGALRDPIETLLFTDGIKRVVQTKKDIALHTGPGRTPIDSVSVSGRVVFDFAGRAVEQYYPVSEPKGGNTAFNPAFDTVPPTRTEYDVLDRSVRTTLPDRTVTTLQYGFGRDRAGQTRFETVVVDANGKQKKSYRDVRELITSVQEFNPAGGQPVIWTSYGYDALKQIVEVVDDRNNTTRVQYDNFGRRTVIDNPDTGRTETVYDLADNPVAKITANLRAKGREIRYAYDYNRLKSIAYPDFPGNDVAYFYGAPGAAENAASRIVKVTSEAGTETRGYGLLGELTRQTWSIASDTKGNSANSPEVYTTNYRFDTWNRLMQMGYPDGEVLTYHYDSGGLVDGVNGVKSGVRTDYLGRLDYDKFEQRTYLELGNGMKTAYAYDPLTRRLCALDTAKDAQGGTCRDFGSAPDTAPGLQALVYQYDAVGNITGLRNTVAVPPASQFGGPVRQQFGYDDLYRLTQAEGSYRTSPNTQRDYRLDMAYDSIHNITSKQQADRVTEPGGAAITQKKTSYAWTYGYAPSGPASVRPHAPIHIGERTYSYDANGNQTGWDNDDNGTRRSIVWDEENRIQSVSDNGHEQNYWYDDSGERVIKRGPQGETVYVNQWYTIRDRSIGTKHVWAGSSRIASRLVGGAASGRTPSSVTTVTTVTAPTFPGQGVANRSETADLHAQNTVQNPNFSGTTTTTTMGETLPTRDNFLYYYHPDHLGSTSHVTDAEGKLFEHIEYFPFGESWVEEHSNTQRTPYLFTGKELDEETGLYYFGARYYDARTGVWQSADPILRNYLTGEVNGGVYDSRNLALFSYAYNSPTVLIDPDGRSPSSWESFVSFFGSPGPVGNLRRHNIALAQHHVVLAAAELDNHRISPERYNLEVERARGYLQAAESLPETNTGTLLVGIEVALSATGARGAIGYGKGVLANANFAQRTIRADRKFSDAGQRLYSGIAGTRIQTVDDLVAALRNGKVSSGQIAVDYVDLKGTRLILNTRTSTALQEAGIPKSQWIGRNRTGQQVPGEPAGTTFDDLARDQLRRNKLPDTGSPALGGER